MAQAESHEEVVLLVLRGTASHVAAAYRELEVGWIDRPPSVHAHEDRTANTDRADGREPVGEADRDRELARDRDAPVVLPEAPVEPVDRPAKAPAPARRELPADRCDRVIAWLRRRHRLTDSQCVILALRGRAWTNAEVAAALRCSASTVKSHLTHALRSCDAEKNTNVPQLLAAATIAAERERDTLEFVTADDEWRGQLGIALLRRERSQTDGGARPRTARRGNNKG